MTVLADTPAGALARERERFAERVLGSARGTFDVLTLYLGVRLGLYLALARHGPLTAAELAARTCTDARYAREWLEQQTVTRVLTVDDERAPADRRRYRLPAGHAEVLVERDSLHYLAPLARMLVSLTRPLPELLTAFKTGRGIPFADYGDDMRDGQGALNRAAFLQRLGTEWLPSLADVHARLLADPPARVADVGCGVGWSSLGVARSYPKVRVDGFDLDAPSIARARRNLCGAGLSNPERVRFDVCDAGDPALAGSYDLVMALECIHDLAQPVAALSAMRRLARPGGAVLVVDERVGERFTAAGNDVEWLMYGWSVLHCLPAGRANEPSSATGAVMRPDTLERYARDAGFERVEILPIDDFLFRFYRLHTREA